MNQFDHQGFTAEGRATMNGTSGLSVDAMQLLTGTQGLTPHGVQETTGTWHFLGNALLQQQNLLPMQRQDQLNQRFFIDSQRRGALEPEPFKVRLPVPEPLRFEPPKTALPRFDCGLGAPSKLDFFK